MPALPIVELRRYRLVPGGRDTLVTLFEREFLESQDAVGAHVLGQFELQGEPDQFVWLRGFTGMQERKAALASFYDGPVWAEHGPKANATMIDSDDVHLLTVMTPADGFMRPSRPRRPKGARIAGGSRFVIVLYRWPKARMPPPSIRPCAGTSPKPASIRWRALKRSPAPTTIGACRCMKPTPSMPC